MWQPPRRRTTAAMMIGIRIIFAFLLHLSECNGSDVSSYASASLAPGWLSPKRRRKSHFAFNVPFSPTVSRPMLFSESNQRSRLKIQESNGQFSKNKGSPIWYESHVARIKSRNLAGIVNSDGKEVTINLGEGPNLVAVTGETGSGKSLLIARVAEICTGGKVTSSYIPSSGGGAERSSNNATVEMVFRLSEPHLSRTKEEFDRFGLDRSLLDNSQASSMGTLVLKRTLSCSNSLAARLRSSCEINGQLVTLKVLRSVAAPLLTIVDAPVAAAALAKPHPRLAVLDTAVPCEVMADARYSMLRYRKCRKHREKLEQELASRVLPPSITDTENGDVDLVLLKHWVDELDAFEDRMLRFSTSLSAPTEKGDASLDSVHALKTSSWSDNSMSSEDSTGVLFSSSLYENLLEFREAMKSLECQLQAANDARDALGAVSLPESAITAMGRARNLLFDAAGSNSEDGPLSDSAERCHDLLNHVEEAMDKCLRSIESDNKGLINVLENMRRSVDIPLEDIDTIISDWNTLSRKHGISPYVLPSCHMALRSELDGNVEARSLLPKAVKDEQAALTEFELACQVLTNERKRIAGRLSVAVTQRMPALGFGRSTFEALFHSSVRNCSDISVYGGGSTIGVDAVDFMLHHGDGSEMNQTTNDRTCKDSYQSQSRRGGKLEVVASSGEKARILLAIETELPGSVGASCGSPDRGFGESAPSSGDFCPPVTVIYDEIDAHVGGRAAVSVAEMLADQSRQRGGDITGNARGQVVSITHSPSVAAVADLHVVIQKEVGSKFASQRNEEGMAVSVHASSIEGLERRRELARMASGDLAVDEAEVFADALIRDGAKRKQES